jgi:general secretion pathway protein C
MIDPTSVHIKRALFSKMLQHYEKLRGSTEIKPARSRAGLGFAFRRVRSDNVIHKLGIRNGDIVQKINGEQFRAEHVRAALMPLRTADKFTLAVERGGQTLNINYNID